MRKILLSFSLLFLLSCSGSEDKSLPISTVDNIKGKDAVIIDKMIWKVLSNRPEYVLIFKIRDSVDVSNVYSIRVVRYEFYQFELGDTIK